MKQFQVRLANYALDAVSIRAVREAVFIQEQGIPAELEWDDDDTSAQHILALRDNTAIGTARLLTDGRIGRMAVAKQWRGCGVGSAMLTQLAELARQRGHQRVTLSAQLTAAGFYLRHGFVPVGEIYQEADIPHQKMVREFN